MNRKPQPIEPVRDGRPLRTHRGLLRQAARACGSALAEAGVGAFVVGSVAYDAIHPESDLDLLIVSHAGKTWGQVRALVDAAAGPYAIRIDLIYAETLPPAIRRAMLKDARRSGEL